MYAMFGKLAPFRLIRKMDRVTFSRWDETPLYRQLARVLQAKIETGELPPGTRLPSENELADHYHLSRDTVRKALRLLHQQGMIRKYRGRGSYVPPKMDPPGVQHRGGPGKG